MSSVLAKDVKIKRPVGVLPLSHKLERFYRLEVMKLAIGIIMKSNKHTLFLNSAESESTQNIVDFLEFNFVKKNNLFDLNVNLITNGQVKRDVNLSAINKLNILFYVRLAIYEVLFGKAYLDKNYQSLLDEHKREYGQVKQRFKKTYGMEISESSFFKSVSRYKKNAIQNNKFSKKASKAQLNIDENENEDKIKNHKKNKVVVKRVRKKKSQLVAKKKSVKAKSNSREKSQLSSGDSAQLSKNLDEKRNEFREYSKRYNRNGVMAFGVNLEKLSKSTQDLLLLDYEIDYLNGSFLYEVPNVSTRKDSFWFNFNYLYPLKSVVLNIGEIQQELELDSVFSLGSNYKFYVEDTDFGFYGGLSLEKTQFINLGVENQGIQLAKVSGVYIQAGICVDGTIFNQKFQLEADIKKLFFGSVEYEIDSEVAIDSLILSFLGKIKVYKNYFFTTKALVSEYSSRTRTSFNDSEFKLSVGAVYHL